MLGIQLTHGVSKKTFNNNNNNNQQGHDTVKRFQATQIIAL